MITLLQTLEQQEKLLTKQIEEQNEKVKSVAPDEKQLKTLQVKVDEYKKGKKGFVMREQETLNFSTNNSFWSM